MKVQTDDVVRAALSLLQQPRSHDGPVARTDTRQPQYEGSTA
jgi:hypothetical protein